jgi:hypothetical protein
VLPSAAEEDQRPKWPKQDIPGVPSQTERTAPSKPTAASSRPASSPTNLRYEGKTFEEWRDASRIELSTERQLVAVQALAAFGANGYAREATDAILDVATKHDFGASSPRDSAESRLKFAIYDSFTSRRSIGKSIAFPMIFQRYERAPETWHDFVVYVLSRPPSLPSEVVALIRPLLEHEQPDMRAAALEATHQSNPAGSAELLTNALRDPDPQVVTKGLQLVGQNESRLRRDPMSAKVEFPIDRFLELIFRPDSERGDPIRELARDMLSGNESSRLSDESIGQVVARLMEVLNDPSRKDEHVLMIRAIRRVARGPRSNNRDAILDSYKATLERIFRESEDVQLRIAAAFALQELDGNMNRSNQLIREAADLPKDAREQMRQLIDAEEDANW